MEITRLPWTPLNRLPPAVREAWDTVAAMPFENLSKVIKFHEAGQDPAAALRLPDEVLADHRRHGTGATCFALVYLFRRLLDLRGIPAGLHTCDRRCGPDTHAAAVVAVAGQKWLFDPGFHIVQPLPAPGEAEAAFRAPGNPNASRVRRLSETRFECYTGHAGAWTLRFILKIPAVGEERFRAAWMASYSAEMMAYPVLNRFENGRMLYLQKSTLVVRDGEGSEMVQLSMADLPDRLAGWYGIAPGVIRRALALCRRK